ncbi:MAG: BadF/BadG/BcrA/BcrD ATPase family protein [Rubricoccaceae bacterium]|nr:BadF/BadG/BcrA/BcrD ATPase family protein [Rubricoccaceae bacterium]
MSSAAPPLFVGVDAGGSKTALRIEGGEAVVERTGPGVNVRRDGVDAATERLGALLADALGAFPEVRLGGLAAGLAGAGDPAVAHRIEATLRGRLSLSEDVPVTVVHDAEIALEAAFGEETGIVVIAGTGSIVYGRTAAGATLRAGGWGSRLGDAGSGTALGRATLRAACTHHDGGPPTRLTARLAEDHALDTLDALLGWAYDGGDLAALAPLLLATAPGDAVAGGLLDAETDALAQQAAWLARRAGGRLEKRVALLGGLVREGGYRQALLQALAHRLPGWYAAPSEREPVEGAVALARRRARAAP